MNKFKNVVVVILSVFLLSCTKNNTEKDCYWCEFGAMPGGNVPPSRMECVPEGDTPGPFQDNQGNDMSFVCTRM